MKKLFLSAFIAIAALATTVGMAQAPEGGGQRGGGGRGAGAPGGAGGRGGAPDPVEKIRQLKPNLYLITGRGANTRVRVTLEGLIVADPKHPGEQLATGLIGADTMPLPNASPGINPSPNNGSAVQVPKLLENILKLDFDTAIAGRGEPMTKADVQAYKAKWDTFMSRARDAIKKGVSKEEFMTNVKQDDLGWNFNAGFFNNFYDELKATGAN